MKNSHTIKVLQYMHGELEYFPLSEKINRRYCLRHDYEYRIVREEARSDRHTTWHKIPVILKEIRDCDYLLFMDADAIFYSQELTIEEDLIPHMGRYDILMAQDIGNENCRWTPGKPNSGVILMKNNDRVRRFFEYWDKSSDIDESTRWNWPPEQLALWNVVMPKFPDLVNVHSEYYLIQGRYGQYIRHFMFMSTEDKTERLKKFCHSRNIAWT